MKTLDVPYFQQTADHACGVAALHMVYKYHRPSKLSKFSQEKIYRRLGKPDPHAAWDRAMVTTDDIVTVARSRTLHAAWGRVDPSKDRLIEQVKFFVEGEQVPLIACQQVLEQPLFGHFRVILGISDTEVRFHDPHPQNGGKNMQWPIDRFMDAWRHTGDNVTGGVAIWISKTPVASPLDPDQPNYWVPVVSIPQV